MSVRGSLALVGLLLGLVACGDDSGGTDVGSPDGGVDAAPDAPDAPAEDANTLAIMEPIAPAAPEWPCPEGWTEQAAPAEFIEAAICAPPSGPSDCSAGDARFLSGSTCAPIAPLNRFPSFRARFGCATSAWTTSASSSIGPTASPSTSIWSQTWSGWRCAV